MMSAALGEELSGQGRSFSDAFVAAYKADDAIPAFQALFNKALAEALPREKIAPFFAEVRRGMGSLKSESGPVKRDGMLVFVYTFEKGRLQGVYVPDKEGKLGGFQLTPVRPTIPAKELATTKLTFPFRKGSWLVFWGGENPDDNPHMAAEGQKYGVDLVVMGADGKTNLGSGKKNDDYLAFGQDVVAPADGLVTDVVDGIRDNEPGSMNKLQATGNTVTIQLADDEYLFIAHFKQGSIKVKAGQSVKRDTVLGLSGNSGNSSEAHIHMHVMNTPVLQDATGIKYQLEGKFPQKGDVLTRLPDDKYITPSH